MIVNQLIIESLRAKLDQRHTTEVMQEKQEKKEAKGEVEEDGDDE